MNRSLTLIAAFAFSFIGIAQNTWTITENGLPAQHYISSFAESSGGDLFSAGATDGNNPRTPLIARFNASQQSWSVVQTSGLPTDFPISDIVSSHSKLYVVSYLFPSMIFESSDNGATWASVMNGFGNNIRRAMLSVDPVSGDLFCLARSESDYEYRVYKLNASNQWNVISSGGILDDIHLAKAFDVNSKGIFISCTSQNGITFKVYRSTDAGQTWNEPTTGLPSNYLTAIYENQFGAVYVSVQSYYVPKSQGNILFEFDGGTNQWNQMVFNVPDTTLEVVDFIQFNGSTFIAQDSTYSDSGSTDISQTINPLKVEQFAPPTFRTSPNPASDFIHISSEQVPVGLTLLDLTGRTVLKEELHGQDQRIAVDAITPGVYLLRVEFDSGVENTQRVVVR
ncbi:MAG: T9SS type A sorting domain-containing protein [Flavobacteriia bacterium]|nr:T9SS type A sorting domain-containing protein [Flavobacteriia bacterium]